MKPSTQSALNNLLRTRQLLHDFNERTSKFNRDAEPIAYDVEALNYLGEKFSDPSTRKITDKAVATIFKQILADNKNNTAEIIKTTEARKNEYNSTSSTFDASVSDFWLGYWLASSTDADPFMVGVCISSEAGLGAAVADSTANSSSGSPAKSGMFSSNHSKKSSSSNDHHSSHESTHSSSGPSHGSSGGLDGDGS